MRGDVSCGFASYSPKSNVGVRSQPTLRGELLCPCLVIESVVAPRQSMGSRIDPVVVMQDQSLTHSTLGNRMHLDGSKSTSGNTPVAM